jgi:hypothetical protein
LEDYANTDFALQTKRKLTRSNLWAVFLQAKRYDKAPDAHRRLRRTAPPGFLSSAPLPPPDNAVSSVSMIEAGSELLKVRAGKGIGLISINFAERIRRVEHISIVHS